LYQTLYLAPSRLTSALKVSDVLDPLPSKPEVGDSRKAGGTSSTSKMSSLRLSSVSDRAKPMTAPIGAMDAAAAGARERDCYARRAVNDRCLSAPIGSVRSEQHARDDHLRRCGGQTRID
jgi:hypothetical protein